MMSRARPFLRGKGTETGECGHSQGSSRLDLDMRIQTGQCKTMRLQRESQIHRASPSNRGPGLPSANQMIQCPPDGFLFISLPCDFTIVFTASVFSTNWHYPPEFETPVRNRGDRKAKGQAPSKGTTDCNRPGNHRKRNHVSEARLAVLSVPYAPSASL